ncbi:MAG TPA: S-adenosylmethionine:tRNA ribosyltransferase-isomerase [Thermoleophilaceae bacterium]|nr:S-adenosylmethionine:tRNA ribosyltransferase-isomerase [Thermoleophilaceae bacterium]
MIATHALSVAELEEAREPAEERGRGRDDVRLLVARARAGLEHAHFTQLPELLDPGDLLVINTSATLPAAVTVRGPEAGLALNLSGPANGDDPHLWLAELRRAGERYRGGQEGQVLLLPAGATAVLLERHPGGRLWRISLRVPGSLDSYLARHGQPIRYRHLERSWPLDRFRTVYATEPGSAEMPSAGRAFTTELVTRLIARGVDLAPLVLHTGVSSLEIGETPQPERFRVPRFTAARINLTRELGGRVLAVGTTVVRALEAAVGADGRVRARQGWADLVIEPETEIRALGGLLSGFHDRDSSHLAMLEAIAGRDLLERSYDEALHAGYLRHEFGDLHLLLR